MTSDMLEVNFKANVNRDIEEAAGSGKGDTAAEEFSEGKMINEESGCNKKDNVPEEVTPRKFFKYLKIQQTLGDISWHSSAKDKMLKAIKE